MRWILLAWILLLPVPALAGTMGNANGTGTASAHSDGGNCSAGSYPLGVDENGAVQNCTDATTEIDSAISTHTSATTVDAGRSNFTICGEAATINNNTVYYGPNISLAQNSTGLTCDKTAAGNTTEATADAPIYTNQAVGVSAMTCRNNADANADVSFTLRSAAAATTPSVTCTISDNERDCVADVQTTVDIAAAATVAIAAASTSDVTGTQGFACQIEVEF